jgi:hypothetical protein
MKRLLVAGLALAALAVTLTACAGGQADKADPVGSTTATLNGYWKSTVSNPQNVVVFFAYGTTTAYGRYAGPSAPDGNCVSNNAFPIALCSAAGPANMVHKYSAPVTGLAPNTTYHFSLCANDFDPNQPNCMNDVTFKTGQ